MNLFSIYRKFNNRSISLGVGNIVLKKIEKMNIVCFEEFIFCWVLSIIYLNF